MEQQKSAEAIVGLLPQAEGLNTRNRLQTKRSMTTEVAEKPVEMAALTAEQHSNNNRNKDANT